MNYSEGRKATARRRELAGASFVDGGKATSIVNRVEKRLAAGADKQTDDGKKYEATATSVLLLGLDSGLGMCRWPVGDSKPQLFCGAPTLSGKSYCAEHYAECWSKGTLSERDAPRDLLRMAAHA